MLFRYVVIVAVLFGLALPASARMPDALQCPSQQSILACVVDELNTASPSRGFGEQACQQKALRETSITQPYNKTNTTIPYPFHTAHVLIGVYNGGIDRPPKSLIF